MGLLAGEVNPQVLHALCHFSQPPLGRQCFRLYHLRDSVSSAFPMCLGIWKIFPHARGQSPNLVVVMALNFLHTGGSYVPSRCMRRPANEAHSAAFSRLTGMIEACARLTGRIPLLRQEGHACGAQATGRFGFRPQIGLTPSGYPGMNGPPSLVRRGVWKSLRSTAKPTLALFISGTGSWDLGPHLGSYVRRHWRAFSGLLAVAGGHRLDSGLP